MVFYLKEFCIDQFFNWCRKYNKASNIQLEIILPWHFQYLFWINYVIKITSIVISYMRPEKQVVYTGGED